MAERRTHRTAVVMAMTVIAAAATAGLSGCSSDEGAHDRAQLSSVEAKAATAQANEKAAADFVRGDQHLNNVQGPARMAEFDALAARTCPGSAANKRLAKVKADGKVAGFGYLPNKQTEIVGASTEADPNNVLVVVRYHDPSVAQQQKPQAFALRVAVGTTGGTACINDVTRV